jgi:hypothetical protein
MGACGRGRISRLSAHAHEHCNIGVIEESRKNNHGEYNS